MPEPVIDIQQLCFSYVTQPVLEDITLAIQPNEIAAIVGPNGSGKTTLLKVMLGLLQPNRGSIRVLGLSPERARPRIGYIPQHLSLDSRFPISVLDVVLMGRIGYGRFGFFSRADKHKAMSVLEEVNLSEKASAHFF